MMNGFAEEQTVSQIPEVVLARGNYRLFLNVAEKSRAKQVVSREDLLPSLNVIKENVDGMIITYFCERGISQEKLKRNGVMQKDENQLAIASTYKRHGELVSCKYRDIKKHFWQENNTEKIFYGLDDINDVKEMIIVEGEIDKLSMEEAGFCHCVSVPDGAPSKVSAKELPSEDKLCGSCGREEVIGNLKGRPKILDGDNLIEQSVKLLRVKDPLFKRMGASRIIHFATDDEKRIKVVELGGAHGLVNMLKAVKDDRTCKEALRALVVLSYADIDVDALRALHLAGASSVISSTPNSSEDAEVMGYKSSLLKRFQDLKFDTTS
ncbi:hypothetical protein GIB67_028440 [Kingdonia uniflora]|uniref:Toprim domain-containing protein n=1 Tax=Kingdonia uniflora TaxID=39325 RepID=A0A7J7P1N2_9MAGN|nr:hypothetical protein GIB67_028440 [Kingdonia uniflora]